jgi:hypothetical protein
MEEDEPEGHCNTNAAANFTRHTKVQSLGDMG